jgi:hypothetical protein
MLLSHCAAPRLIERLTAQLYKVQQDSGFILHMLHISGKRMKATGVDGLSRGDHTEGMMAGDDNLLPAIPFGGRHPITG